MAFVTALCVRARVPSAQTGVFVCSTPPACGSLRAWGAVPVGPSSSPPPRRARWAAQFGGGFLGVGPSEAAVILLVGWFVLGPQKLFTLSRDVGRIVGDLRRAADDARTTFTDALESEVAAEEEKRAVSDISGKSGSSVTNASSDADALLERIDGDAVSDLLRDSVPSVDGTPGADLSFDRTVLPVMSEWEEEAGEKEDAESDAADAAGKASDQIVSRQRFLDQLRRSQDPAQAASTMAAPGFVGDIQDLSQDDFTEEDGVRIARLEYELAIARLAAKQNREAIPRNSPDKADATQDNKD
jgi:sec-independent protein translocase protein TatB